MVVNAFKNRIFTLELAECTGNLGTPDRVAPFSESEVLYPTSLKLLSPKNS